MIKFEAIPSICTNDNMHRNKHRDRINKIF